MSQVDTSVPVPQRRKRGRPPSPEYALVKSMAVGDSVFFRGRPVDSVKASFVRRPELAVLQQSNWQFQFAEAIENEYEGTRVWRIA